MGVTILPSSRTPWDLIGAQIGQNVQQVLPGAVQQGYNRGQLQNSLDAIKSISKDPNASQLDITLAAIKAGAGIPGSERYLAQLIPLLSKQAEAAKTQNIQYPGEDPTIQPQAQGISTQGQQPPGFMQSPGQPQQDQQNAFFPTNIGPQGGPGQVPQAATSGTKQPLLSTSERIAESKKLSKQLTDNGILTTPREALEMVDKNEDDKKLRNAEIDTELDQRITGQKTYGTKAVNYLRNAFPKPKEGEPSFITDEMEAIFAKKGEEASTTGKSEAEIDRYLANEAKNFRNAVVNVEKSISAPRLLDHIGKAFNNNFKDFNEAASDIRGHLEPLLKEGLFDTARNLLSKHGYGPEEIEAIIHPLSVQSDSILNQLPSVKGFSGFRDRASHINPQNVKDALLQMRKADPNFSLLLARKGFEDKGYDWRDFKNAFNQLINETKDLEINPFPLTDDQKIQSGMLDTPPLSTLETILKGLDLGGR